MPCVRNLERLTQRKPVAGRPTRRRAMQGFGLGQARLSQNVWFPASLQPQRVCLSECTNVSRLVLHWGNPPIVAFGGVLALCVGMGHVSPPGTLYKCRVKTTSASVDRLPKDGKGEREGGGSRRDFDRPASARNRFCSFGTAPCPIGTTSRRAARTRRQRKASKLKQKPQN